MSYNQSAGSSEPKNEYKGEESTKIIPVIEEHVIVDKKVIETGKVRITKKVEEEEVFVNIPVDHEEVIIKRIPVNKFVESDVPSMRQEGDTLVIPILKEVVVTRLMLVEEVHVNKNKKTSVTQEKVVIRKEEVTINRDKPENP